MHLLLRRQVSARLHNSGFPDSEDNGETLRLESKPRNNLGHTSTCIFTIGTIATAMTQGWEEDFGQGLFASDR